MQVSFQTPGAAKPDFSNVDPATGRDRLEVPSRVELELLLASKANAASLAGKADANFTAPFTGAVARPVVHKLTDVVSIRDWRKDAGTDGLNDSATFQTALDALYNGADQSKQKALWLPAGYYAVGPAFVGADYCIMNPGVSIQGENMATTGITSLFNLPATPTLRLMRVRPTTRVNYLELSRLSLSHGNDGLNGPLIEFDIQGSGGGISYMKMERLALGASVDVSLRFKNDDDLNPEGLPALSQVFECVIATGVDMDGMGDSTSFVDGRIGRKVGAYGSFPEGHALVFRAVFGEFSGSGLFSLDRLNTVGVLRFLSGRHIDVGNLNMEVFKAGASNGACIDLDGSVRRIESATLRAINLGIYDDRNGLGELIEASTVNTGLRINNAEGVSVQSVVVSAGKEGLASGVLVTDQANDTDLLGPLAVSAGFAAKVTDNGAGTRNGPGRAIPYGANVVASAVNPNPATVQRTAARATLSGNVRLQNSTSGSFGPLGAGFRPPTIVTPKVHGLDANGTPTMLSLTIATGGQINVQAHGNFGGAAALPIEFSLEGVSYELSPTFTPAI